MRQWLQRSAVVSLLVSCGPGTSPTASTGPVAASIEIHGPASGLAAGGSFTMTAVVRDQNGNPIDSAKVTWTSSDPVIAGITPDGVLFARAKGTAVLTAHAGSVAQSFTLVVVPDIVRRLTLVGPADSLKIGSSFAMIVAAYDSSGASIDSPSLTWTSAAPTVASVSASGVITALSGGSTTITATAGSVSSALVVNVRPDPPASITLAAPADSLNDGATVTLAVIVRDSAGRTNPLPPLTWSSGNPSVATVSALGTVTGIGLGSAVIRVQAGALFATATVNVRDGPVAAGIVPAGEYGDTIEIAPGQSFQLFGFKYHPAAANALSTPLAPPVWTTSLSPVATVTSTGMVTGVAPGTTTITATIDQATATKQIRVASTAGMATIRMINAADQYDPLSLRAGGTARSLAFGELVQQMVPAGTVQLYSDNLPITSAQFYFEWLDLQQFTGYLPAGTRATLVAVSNTDYAIISGPLSFAALWDWSGPIAPDSAAVRVLLATSGGYNVFFTPPGAAAGIATLIGCYLDWPFGYTDYAMRSGGAFDIVMQAGKFSASGPEVARFHVTPMPGHATTYVLAGSSVTTLKMFSYIDQ